MLIQFACLPAGAVCNADGITPSLCCSGFCESDDVIPPLTAGVTAFVNSLGSERIGECCEVNGLF